MKKKAISNKPDKLVSINGESVDKTWFRYKVIRTRQEVTEWEIESTKKLDKTFLVHSAMWRETTGGNKDFPYGLVEYKSNAGKHKDFSVDVGWGAPIIDHHNTTEWDYKLTDVTISEEDDE